MCKKRGVATKSLGSPSPVEQLRIAQTLDTMKRSR